MRIFELPEMEISRFAVENIVTMSGGVEPVTGNSLTQGADGAAGNSIISDTVSTYSIGYDKINMGA